MSSPELVCSKLQLCDQIFISFALKLPQAIYVVHKSAEMPNTVFKEAQKAFQLSPKLSKQSANVFIVLRKAFKLNSVIYADGCLTRYKSSKL
jgi:hypothetical protein